MSQELEALKERRAQDQADAAARKAVISAERCRKRRDTLLSGEWWPSHDCDICLQCILDENPSGVCQQGKSYVWW
jgi:hypothetical protein